MNSTVCCYNSRSRKLVCGTYDGPAATKSVIYFCYLPRKYRGNVWRRRFILRSMIWALVDPIPNVDGQPILWTVLSVDRTNICRFLKCNLIYCTYWAKGSEIGIRRTKPYLMNDRTHPGLVTSCRTSSILFYYSLSTSIYRFEFVWE